MAPAACGSCSRRCYSVVRFVDFLRTTVLLSAGAATALAAITVLAAGARSDTVLAEVAVGWWLIAVAVGLRMGRRAHTNPPIARLLSGAQASTHAARAPSRARSSQPTVAACDVHAAVRRPRLSRAADPRHRCRLRDHLGACLAPPGRGGGGDRGARWGVLLRASNLAGATHGTGSHPGFKAARPERAGGAVT